MTVSGTIVPDVTGTYNLQGQHQGEPYWTDPVSGYSIFKSTAEACHYIAVSFPDDPDPPDAWWTSDLLRPDCTYTPVDPATGVATVTRN